jgi:hypothetical protein
MTKEELVRLNDQRLRQCRIDAPISRLVRLMAFRRHAPSASKRWVGHSRTPNRLAEAHVIELCSLCRQAGLNIAQTFAVRQSGLRERRRPVLRRAGKPSHTMVATIPFDQPREGRPWDEVHQLREQGLARVHDDLQADTWQTEHASGSSRHHPFCLENGRRPGVQSGNGSVNRTLVGRYTNSLSKWYTLPNAWGFADLLYKLFLLPANTLDARSTKEFVFWSFP